MKRAVTDWRQGYGVVDPTNKEVISYTLWERQTYTSATTTELSFFTGSATSGLAGNLPLGGQLPNGWAVLVQAIRIFVAQEPEILTATIASGAGQNVFTDLYRLITQGTAKFSVGDKEYGRWPIFMLPGGAGITGQLALAGTFTAGDGAETSIAQSGVADPRAVYTLGVPVVIPPQYNFSIVCEWPTAQTMLAGNPFIYTMLDGELIRPTQ